MFNKTFPKLQPILQCQLVHRPNSLFSTLYSQKVVNKFIVSRSPTDCFSVYLDADISVAQFKSKVQQLFPTNPIGVWLNVDEITSSIGSKVSEAEQKKAEESLKDISCIDALILNKLAIFEKDSNNEVRIVYGIEVSEHNHTNKINIPEFIEEGIIELNNEWSQKDTVSNALDFNKIRRLKDVESKNEGAKEIEAELSKEESRALRESIEQLIKIKKFNDQIGPYLPQTNRLMKRIITMMSVNWAFLFYLTYAKYGWDVGEPVSYLTGLGVDLLAMMGLFEANRALSTQRQNDKKLIEAVINLPSSEKLAMWRISYLNRKISS